MDGVTLVLYDSVLFRYGGDVHRWANRLERRYVTNAIQEAPARSGELKAGISGESFKYGPKHWQVHIHSDAPHTMYVLRGTTGPIMSDEAWAHGGNPPRVEGKPTGMMLLRPGNGFGYLYRLAVSGQSPNDFFARAHNATARRHPSLRPGGISVDPSYGY